MTEEGDIMVSFDVESLFTRVTITETMEEIRKVLPEDIEHRLRTSYFLYNREFYKQKDEVATGSPLSQLVAKIYMETFEEIALETQV